MFLFIYYIAVVKIQSLGLDSHFKQSLEEGMHCANT